MAATELVKYSLQMHSALALDARHIHVQTDNGSEACAQVLLHVDTCEWVYAGLPLGGTGASSEPEGRHSSSRE